MWYVKPSNSYILLSLSFYSKKLNIKNPLKKGSASVNRTSIYYYVVYYVLLCRKLDRKKRCDFTRARSDSRSNSAPLSGVCAEKRASRVRHQLVRFPIRFERHAVRHRSRHDTALHDPFGRTEEKAPADARQSCRRILAPSNVLSANMFRDGQYLEVIKVPRATAVNSWLSNVRARARTPSPRVRIRTRMRATSVKRER